MLDIKDEKLMRIFLRRSTGAGIVGQPGPPGVLAPEALGRVAFQGSVERRFEIEVAS